MILAIGIEFEQGLTCSLGVDSINPELIASALTIHGGCRPDQILLVQNDLVIGHYNLGKDY